ncbi:NAD(P)H-dependent oxidoreductase [Staphylococcus sp. SQ8-PEA]|uniref:NAD(P)H-dependent oxidoreductase n=1 Tax=Staphylococcus marylandisciuri TaxID=2981529 RepID=A0ABT2QMY3_9STAP|nr:NAD(P)H-dependent oxidoreductase [Staphylococcus marylandisciuri]MCU5745339.1 NAD(P)H-dependent oxidoreductase [Staphylococcus marylandisciuri]
MANKDLQQQIIEAFNFRHATKRFDASRKIEESDFNTILEAARLSPSSLGLEPWRFLVVQSEDLRNKFHKISGGAKGQLETASHFVLILARKNVTKSSPHVHRILSELKQYDEDSIKSFGEKVEGFQTGFHINDNERTLLDWASKQTYIALGNMMTSAALLGIDSCPMEGFDIDAMERLLDEEGIADSKEFAPSVMVAFGYREKDPKPKVRQAQQDVVEWL